MFKGDRKRRRENKPLCRRRCEALATGKIEEEGRDRGCAKIEKGCLEKKGGKWLGVLAERRATKYNHVCKKRKQKTIQTPYAAGQEIEIKFFWGGGCLQAHERREREGARALAPDR
jgi:hypothetical protein